MEMSPFRTSFRRNEVGAAALEFAIIAAVFFTLSLGIIEIGRALQLRNELNYAADFGERQVLMDSNAAESTILDAIRNEFQGYDPKDLTLEIVEETVDGTDFAVIDLSYPVQIFVPGFSSLLTLNVSRRVPRTRAAGS